MKIRKIIKKDLKLFRRDKKTLALVIIAPTLILLILGFIFGEPSTKLPTAGITVGLCNLDDQPLKDIRLSIKFKTIYGRDCEEKSRLMVTKGQLKAAITIPPKFSKNIEEGLGSEIKVHLDNSRLQTALVITDAVKAMVQDLNENIGTKFIENAWVNLRNLNNNLKLIIVHLETAKQSAESFQKKLDDINNDLRKIDEKELDRNLNLINNTFNRLNLTILSNINSEIQENIDNIKLLNNSQCPNKLTKEECTIINSLITNLESIYNRLNTHTANINSLINTTNITKFSEQIELIKATKTNIKKEIFNLNATLYNYTNNIIKVSDELKHTSEILDTYTNRDPKNILRPISLEINEVFGKRSYFSFLAPGLIVTLLLFTMLLITSSNIVEERKRGTLARTLLSPIKIPTLLVAKTSYFLILSIIEIMAMLIIASLFGIPINITFNSIIILLLTAINFIMLGLFIGSLSDSENTALLTSLVIALPMFFLSNLFFPLEIMPNTIKAIGNNLPLTLSVHNLDRLITYSTAMNYNHLILLIVYPVIIGALTYLIIKKKPTAE